MSTTFKTIQRRTVQQIRKQLPASFQVQCSANICEFILTLPEYQQASSLALYRSVGREISLDDLWIAALNAGKKCYFPVMKGETLQFFPATQHTHFCENQFGIPEPVVHDPFTLDIDLFCLPLVAFDARGNRLGRGGGYYDKTLAQVKTPFCVGVGYAFQEVSGLFPEPTDIPMQVIVTEQEIRRIK